MARSAKASRKKTALRPAAAPVIDGASPDVVERPDDDCSNAPDGLPGSGPFESYELAQADRDAVGDEALAPGETLQKTVREIGGDDWIDAETGGPADDEPPHLQEV